MNQSSSLLWLQFIGLLAVEVALLTLVVGVWQRFVSSALWRRILWQAATLSVLVITICELSGSGRHFAGWVLNATTSEDGGEHRTSNIQHLTSNGGAMQTEVQGDLRVTPAFQEQVRAQLVANHSGPSPQPDISKAVPYISSFTQKTTPHGFDSVMFEWVVFAWLAGFLVVMGRVAVVRCLVVIFRLQRTAVTNATLLERVRVLAEALGIRRHVRIIESPRLTGPIAFGLLRPTIALPPNFTTRHEPTQQDAMLAHELAHIAGRDAFWYLLADVASALLWWHPMVWWLRRQLHVASESAADEASLIVADGPKVLAECLVELGVRLMPSRTMGGLGVTGFRSHLGRRVHSLLNLRANRWSPPHRLHSALTKTLGAMAMVAMVILCSAWVAPRALTRGDSMTTMQQNWKHSLATLTTMLALSAPASSQAAGPAPANTTSLPPLYAGSTVGAPPPVEPMLPITPVPESRSNPQLEGKLKSIVLDDVKYDGLPLGEVLRHLNEESTQRDPDKKGINFLINPNQPATFQTGSIDPMTGLPVGIAAEPVDIYTITIKFNLPLRNITMKDLLDAIVKVADQPIEYSFEDYGVVISLRAEARMQQLSSGATVPSTPSLFVQTFRVDTNTFIAGLENAFGIYVDAQRKMEAKHMSTEMEIRKVATEKLLSQLKTLSQEELRQVLPTTMRDTVLNDLLSQLNTAQQRVPYGTTADHPDYKAAKATVDKINEQIKSRVAGIMKSLENELSVITAQKSHLDIASKHVSRSRDTQSALRELLKQLGVTMDGNKSVFYNEMTGVVMVRATPQDLEIISAAMETLGGGRNSDMAGVPGMAGPFR